MRTYVGADNRAGNNRRSHMDIFEKWGAAVKEKSKQAAVKAKEVAGIAQLKLQMSTQEELIKKNYLEIGKLYYELYADMEEEAFRKACSEINNARKEIEMLEKQIELLKK